MYKGKRVTVGEMVGDGCCCTYVGQSVWEEEEEVGPGWVVPFLTGPWAGGGLAGSANFSR
jgi:hypothetical protein